MHRKVASFGNLVTMSKAWDSPVGTKVADDIAEWEANDPAFKAERQRMRPYAELAKLVIRLRALEGLSQEELARRMGTTKAAISRLESGRHRPTVETMRRLAEALGGRLTLTIVMPASAEGGLATERREAVAL
jgi:ribosome-binding protein aMBF1 (putative translation factor)